MIELMLILLGAVAILILPFVIVHSLLQGFKAAAESRRAKPTTDRSLLEFLSLLARKTFFAIVIAVMLWACWKGCQM